VIAAGECYMKGRSDEEHGFNCYCGKPAKWHVFYSGGCGHVCGIHKAVIVRRKPGVKATRLVGLSMRWEAKG